MPRDSIRDGNDRPRMINPSRSPVLSKAEIAKRNVRELEERLARKDRALAEKAKLLEHNFGVSVEMNRSYSRSPRRENYMSPIRIGVTDSPNRPKSSSPVCIMSPNTYPETIRPRFTYEQPPFLRDQQLNPNQRENVLIFEHPPDFGGFDQQPPPWYQEEIEVRVEEMPRWPMEGSPSPISTQLRPFPPSFESIWRNQEEVQVEPMPVFPMAGREDEDEQRNEQQQHNHRSSHESSSRNIESSTNPAKYDRNERARLQMEILARQAEEAEKAAQIMRVRSAEEEPKKRQKEEEKRRIREHVAQMRQEVLKSKREKEKEEESRKRKAEREARHLQSKKEEDDKRRKVEKRVTSSAPSSATGHSTPSSSHGMVDGDKAFLKYLEPALGNLVVEVQKRESNKKDTNIRFSDSSSRRSTDRTVYKATCHMVNIPKELICVICERSTRADAYKDAVSKYVSKLVDMGVITDQVRRLLGNKSFKSIAELVEPLCNDIAIFGTQISVTETRDMKTKFVSFCKEKSAEFWNCLENLEHLNKILATKDNVTRSLSKKTKHGTKEDEDFLRNHGNTITGSSSRNRREEENERKKRGSNHKRTHSQSPTINVSPKTLLTKDQAGLVKGVSHHALVQPVPSIASMAPLTPMNGFIGSGINSTQFIPMPMFSQSQMLHQNPAMFPPMMTTYTMTPPIMQQPLGFPYQPNHLHQLHQPLPPGIHRLQPNNPMQQGTNRLDLSETNIVTKPARPEDDIDLMDEVFKTVES